MERTDGKSNYEMLSDVLPALEHMTGFRNCVWVFSSIVATLSVSGGTLLIDPKFKVAGGANGSVTELRVDSSGRILVAGNFNAFAGANRTNLVRLRTSGKLDHSFHPEITPSLIRSIVAQSDRKILLGGADGLCRIDNKGRVDAQFLPQAFDIYSVTLQPDNRIIVGQLGATALYRYRPLMRRNHDGSTDYSFGLSADEYRTAFAVAQRPDGRILAGGDFRVLNGEPHARLALINTDGSVAAGFQARIGHIGATFNPEPIPYVIFLQPDGKILIGGSFTAVDTEPRGGIARLLSDGSIDSSFVTPGGAENGFNGTLRAIALQPDGKIICAGDFTAYAGVTKKYLARLNPDGSLDSDFNSGEGPNGPIAKVVLQGTKRLLIGGSYTTFDGVPQGNISRLVLGP